MTASQVACAPSSSSWSARTELSESSSFELRREPRGGAIAASIGLQHGVPLGAFVQVFTFQKFELDGMMVWWKEAPPWHVARYD